MKGGIAALIFCSGLYFSACGVSSFCQVSAAGSELMLMKLMQHKLPFIYFHPPDSVREGLGVHPTTAPHQGRLGAWQ